MRTTVFAGSLLCALVLAAGPLEAQLVSADVVVHGGPVTAHVAVVDGYSTYRPRRVVYYPAAPHLVVIERVHYNSHGKHWKRHGFRPVTVYYVNGRYYDRWNGPVRGVRRVVVYERNGRYYEPCDRDHHGHDWND
jgi:hypothetical protein